METSKFRFSRLFLYFVLVSLFLFGSGSIGQFLIEDQDMAPRTGMLLQGVIFIGLTILTLYLLKRKDSNVLSTIGLKGMRSPLKLVIGVLLPFVLLVFGIITAYLFGGIDNVRLNLSSGVIISILINAITAFMYEAFPEEVFIRGLIFEELRKKFRFISSLFLQPLFFICVPILVLSLQSIFFNEPFAVGIDYFILLLTFGIALQLYREYTGSLWTSITFHVVFLEVSRYITIGGVEEGQDKALLTFNETFDGYMALYLSFLFMIVSIVVLSVLLLIKKRKK